MPTFGISKYFNLYLNLKFETFKKILKISIFIECIYKIEKWLNNFLTKYNITYTSMVLL